MLVQDTLTGYFHEVPDGQLYETEYGEYPDQIGEGQVLFDGLGNPVGFLPFIPKIAALASRFIPQAARAVSGLFRGGRPAPGLPAPVPGLGPVAQGFPGQALPFRPPWPTGWIPP